MGNLPCLPRFKKVYLFEIEDKGGVRNPIFLRKFVSGV